VSHLTRGQGHMIHLTEVQTQRTTLGQRLGDDAVGNAHAVCYYRTGRGLTARRDSTMQSKHVHAGWPATTHGKYKCANIDTRANTAANNAATGNNHAA